MNNISKNARGALLVGILGPVLFALGNLVPLVKTSLGLSYGVNGDSNAALCVYAAVVALLLVNILSDKMQADIAKRLQILAVLIACGMLVFGLYLSKGGVEWFNVQTAFNLPGMEGAKIDAFWSTMAGFGYNDRSAFGDLRTLYATWGPNVELNNIPVYLNAINSLDQTQLKTLIAAGGISFTVMPMGIVLYLGGVIAQLYLLASRYRNGNA